MFERSDVILAIDTSCDETSVAVTQGQTVLANIIASQVELHRPYGGVFPTVAKLAHQENLAPALEKALKRAQITTEAVDAVVVTIGPGLAPALEVGIRFAQAFCQQYNKPLIPANHLEGHICSVLAQPKHRAITRTSKDNSLNLPVLAVIVSGGNTLFVKVERKTDGVIKDHQASALERQPHLQLDTPANQTTWQPAFQYTILGKTLDDAAGECLDKVGRMLNLGYPAGPVVEEFAKSGSPQRYSFPLPLTQTKTYDMSFSGIKTHSRNLLTELGGIENLTKQDIFDFCAGLQTAIFRHITYKLDRLFTENPGQFHEVWLSGGVAANMALRQAIRETLKKQAKQQRSTIISLRTPYTKKLCGDNAAMLGIVN